ncbi:MAG TPA: hypothetical protein DCE44_19850 [Verrucomicrobiales bacterium]|nr:hypothetical protein [Verrucomicrobiales bacterium]
MRVWASSPRPSLNHLFRDRRNELNATNGAKELSELDEVFGEDAENDTPEAYAPHLLFWVRV